MEGPNAMLHQLPTEILSQIFRLLPYASRSNLFILNKRFNDLLGPEVKREGTALHQIYRQLTVTSRSHTREPVLFELMLDLLRGDVSGNLIEVLIYIPKFEREGFSAAHLSSVDKVLLQEALDRSGWATNHTDLITDISQGQGWPVLAIIITFLTSLRCLWLPMNWASAARPSLKDAMTSVIRETLSDPSTSLNYTPLGRLTHIRMGSGGDTGPFYVFEDLCLLLNLPSLRVLYAQNISYSHNTPPTELAKSHVETIVLMDCNISVRKLVDRIGVPCQIFTEDAYTSGWDSDYEDYMDTEVYRERITISGEIDPDTGLIDEESKTLTTNHHSKGSLEFSQIGDHIQSIANSIRDMTSPFRRP